ncbi:MAG TPA: DUF3450 domain-containing protein [Pseudomonadaceae bacterium]|nr:DUF3450 domain-containing protein [Pseudomonadaceae bacterium]
MIRSLSSLWASVALIACPSVSFAADNPVTDIHALTMQWTAIERQRDELQANWRSDKPILDQQLVLLEREIRELGAVLEVSEQEQDAVEERRLELLEEQTRLEQEQATLERSLAQATIELHNLWSQLPPPLMLSWEEQLPRLDDPLLTDSEKLQTVLELLGQLDDFQQKITINESVMSLADGQDYLVKQIYLGLSHGWYISADGRFGAEGRAGPEGWSWEPVQDLLPVSAIVAILERRQSPELVAIPLRLNARPAQGGN